MPRSALIVGCGFVGLPLARDFASSGWQAHAITASETSAANLRGESFPVYPLDISEKDNFEVLPVRSFDVVIHCASSRRGAAA